MKADSTPVRERLDTCEIAEVEFIDNDLAGGCPDECRHHVAVDHVSNLGEHRAGMVGTPGRHHDDNAGRCERPGGLVAETRIPTGDDGDRAGEVPTGQHLRGDAVATETGVDGLLW